MKERMYYYPFYLRDYLAKTRHLSLMEDLAYRRLLDAYYTQEEPLPADPNACARLICMRDYVAEVQAVLSEFFDLTEAGYTNERCDVELDRFRAMRKGGAVGAAKRWAKGGDSPPTDPPMPTKNQKPRTTKKPPQPPEGEFGFAEFWSAYPKKDAKTTALASWLKLAPDDELRATIVAAVTAKAQTRDWLKDGGQYVPMASTYINQRRWEDQSAQGDGFWSEVGKEPWA